MLGPLALKTPTTFIPHNHDLHSQWEQGYITLGRAGTIMMARAGLIPLQAATNVINLMLLESPPDSPTQTVGSTKAQPTLNVTIN